MQVANMKRIKLGEQISLWLLVISCIVLLISPNSKYYIIPNIEIYFFAFSFVVFALFGNHLLDKGNRHFSLSLLIFSSLYVCFFSVIHFERPFVTVIYEIIFAVIFLSLNFRCRNWIYDKYIKLLSVLFVLGIVEYILINAGIDFFWGTYVREEMEFYQGIFTSIPIYYREVPARFMAFCEEPGLVGTLSFFILITMDRLKYKKEFYIILVAGVLSFSMAFYLLGLLYYLLYFRKYLLSIKSILIITILVSFAMYFMWDVIDYRLLERVNSKDAIESLDNRNSEVVNKKFNEYVKSSDIFLGVGHRTYYDWKKKTENISVGLKEQLFMYGIVGVLMMFLIFSFIYLKYNGENNKNLKIIILYWVSFYQRSYWLFPPLIIVLFRNRNTYENRTLNIS